MLKRMRMMKMLAVLLAVAVCVMPLSAYAAFSFDMLPPDAMKAGSTQTLVPIPPAGSGYSYSFVSMKTDIATVDSTTGEVKALKAGTAYIWVEGKNTSTNETASKLVTLTVGSGSGSSSGKIVISSTTSLDKKVGDPSFTMSVSFNIPRRDVSYNFEISDEEVATIDEDTGHVRIRGEGVATITVYASADGYPDVEKDFTLYVDPRAPSGGGTTAGTEGSGITLSGGTGTAAGTPLPPGYMPSDFQFTGSITVDGMRFRTTNNFSAGIPFAIIPETNDGDWWKTPSSFTGSRGVYTALYEGVATIVYADVKGKQYYLSINSYKSKSEASFAVPTVIPVGAIFTIRPPVPGGRWTKNSEYLSGNGGTYLPLKEGATNLSYKADDKTYSLSITIVGVDDSAADDSGTVNPHSGEQESALIVLK